MSSNTRKVTTVVHKTQFSQKTTTTTTGKIAAISAPFITINFTSLLSKNLKMSDSIYYFSLQLSQEAVRRKKQAMRVKIVDYPSQAVDLVNSFKHLL